MQAGLIILLVLSCLLTFAMISLLVTTGIQMHLDKNEKDSNCDSDTECTHWEECYKGNCREACMNIICGENELCISYFHRYSCECLPGYVRTPQLDCRSNIIKANLSESQNSNVVQGVNTSSVVSRGTL